MEKLEPSRASVENNVAVPQNVKHGVTERSSNSTPRRTPKGNEKRTSTQKWVR